MSKFPPVHPSSKDRGKARKPRNPFSSSEDRDNFPPIDEVFGTPDENLTVDRSSSPDGSSSVLDMSIGARAALNEHLRHVAKFGIDGEKSTSADVSPDPNREPLDEQWNFLLDDQQSHVNSSGSFAAVSSFPRMDTLMPDQSSLEQSIDVRTEISQDFFNSSKVELLTTPERNRHRTEHVMTRDDVPDEAAFLQEEDQQYGTFSEQSVYSHDHEQVPQATTQSATSGERNASFHSLYAVDISHISNSESEPRQPSPNSSFQAQHCLTIDEAPPSPTLADFTTPRSKATPELSEPSSTPRRSPPHDTKTPPFPSSFGPSLSENRSTRLWQSSSKARGGKENYDVGSSSDQAVSKKRNPSSMDSMPTELLSALAGEQTQSGLSPISQVASHVDSSASSAQQHKRIDDPSFSGTSTSSTPSLTGRKMYRTVVPRRVYMNSPSEFPEEHDSFGIHPPASLSVDDGTPRSLLDSFEAAYDQPAESHEGS